MGNLERRKLRMMQRFLPEEVGLRAHLFRVSGLAARVGESRGFSREECEALAQAGLLHHFPFEQMESEAVSRLAEDLRLQSPVEFAGTPQLAGEIAQEFRAGGRAERHPDAKQQRFVEEAASLLEAANLFDEQMEALPYEDKPVAQLVDELFASGLVSSAFQAAIRSFRVTTNRQISEIVKRLPVFPKAAMDALRLARDPNVGAREIEKALAKDPVLAGEIIHLANSGLFGTWNPVNSLSLALARVGTIAAGKLIAAAAIRRCFVSASLHGLWSHSFDSGESAARIAAETIGMDKGEAYLAGLVHDVGRVPYELSAAATEMRRWQEMGFPVTYAEFLVSGTDHAQVSAEILRAWRFPDQITEAVEFHHRPELSGSKLSAVLYCGEDIDEAMPSCARDHLVAKRLEVTTAGYMRVAG